MCGLTSRGLHHLTLLDAYAAMEHKVLTYFTVGVFFHLTSHSLTDGNENLQEKVKNTLPAELDQISDF